MILPYENFIGDSDGEELIWRLFKQELPKEYISFHGYRACTRKPDIMLLVPGFGVLVIENKSIRAKSIAKVINNDTILRYNGPQIPSPLKQADRCGIALLEQVLKPGGVDNVMVYHAVSYPYINEEQFFEKHLDKISSRELTFLKEDLVNFETIEQRINKIFELAYAAIDIPSISKGGFNLVLMDQVANLISPHYKEDVPEEKEKKTEEQRKEVSSTRPDYSIICWCPDGSLFTIDKIDELKQKWRRGTKLYLYTENNTIYQQLCDIFSQEIKDADLPDSFTFKHNMSFRLEIGLIPCGKMTIRENTEIINGEDFEKQQALLNELDLYSSFNYGQYKMEHAPCMDVKVTAGAGTGKTHTMVSRISYLIWKEEVEPEELSNFLIMITFTNKSADEMKHKLFEYFLNCYQLTKQPKYFEYLEAVEDIQISTIHSLCKAILAKYGTKLGLGIDFRITTGNFRRREILREEMDKLLAQNPEITGLTKMKQYFLQKRLEELIDKIDNKNIDLVKDREILDFGNGSKCMPEDLINVVTETQRRLDEELTEQDSVSLKSIIRKVGQLCDRLTEADFLGSQTIRYLFVDEFQDTDNVQIDLIQRFQALVHFNWFVVGDTKQCIYRFRGAEDEAFDWLTKGNHPCYSVALKKNYRTDQNLLEQMNQCFTAWDQKKNLSYAGDDILIGVKELPDDNPLDIIPCGKTLDEDILVNAIREAVEKAEAVNDKAAILVRNNYQIEDILSICRRNQISVGAEIGGRLFQSDPTIDLYKLLLALRYPNEPEYLFNLYTTSYIRYNLHKTDLLGKNKEELVQYFDEHCGIPEWELSKQQVTVLPIMQVLQQIVQKCHPWDRFAELMNNPEKITKYKNYYMRNLDQVFEKLIHIANTDYLTINKLTDYLEIMIATRQEADERETFEDLDGEERLICTTVHKAKGLQYDTVILPYCNLNITNTIDKGNVDIVYDRPRVAYRVTEQQESQKGPKDVAFTNNYYDNIKKDENESRKKEETRILYVAMTRAKRRLVAMITEPKGKSMETWGTLIKEGMQ